MSLRERLGRFPVEIDWKRESKENGKRGRIFVLRTQTVNYEIILYARKKTGPVEVVTQQETIDDKSGQIVMTDPKTILVVPGKPVNLGHKNKVVVRAVRKAPSSS